MTELIVVIWEGETEAARARFELARAGDPSALENAVVVIRRADGRLTLLGEAEQTVIAGPVGPGFFSAVIGFLMGGPLGGITAEALGGAGLDAQFIHAAAEGLRPGTSALFALVRAAAPADVLAPVAQTGAVTLRATLDPAVEAALRRILDEDH